LWKHAAVRDFAFDQGKSRREEARVFGLSCLADLAVVDLDGF
jgi:hypothetical protein